ncbi:MFS transporter [Lysinibacillus endophyticus]|uniref:MFS transporter n=1 Tax=Ureibacillus endophyticus TaxID=1978490 RepID=UPI0020A1AE1C|nr:MFS transporter [Lysinibacillus endophyticus]MCP1146747.1 MFS transporter [Lysinibacillus endophyticus]
MEESNTKIWTGPFFVALTNNFFLFIVYYALLTILPIYILKDLNGTEGQAGLAMTIFMLSAIIVRPFSGRIIEMFGKRNTLLISELLFCLSSILYIFIDSLTLLLSLRFFHGIWFSIVTTVLITVVNDIIPDSRKGAGLGYFALSMNLAVVFGPLIALSIFQMYSYKILIISLATVIIIGYLSAFTLKVSEFHPQTSTAKWNRLTWQDLFEKKVIPSGIVGFLTAFAYASIMSFISVYAETRGIFEYVSLFFIAFSIAMVVVRPFTGKMYDTKGPNSVVYPSFLLYAAGLILLSNMHTVSTLLIAGILIGIGYGSVVPCLQALAIQSAQKHRSGHATSTFFTIFDSGIAIGAFVLGIISANWNYSALYIICGVIIIINIPIYWKIIGRKKNAQYNESICNQQD